MAGHRLGTEQLQEAIDAWHECGCVEIRAAERLGLNRSTFQARLRNARATGLQPCELDVSHHDVPEPRKVARPRTGIKRFIVTAAQDATTVHGPFLANLMAYAAHLDARLVVGGFTYNKALYSDHAPKSGLFAEEIQPHLSFEQTHVAGSVAICAEMNTLPTAVHPLSGLEGYSGSLHGVFPHAKVALTTVAQPKATGAKFNMTTGAVTLPNYVQKKAGMKAQFHHILGALLIEVDNRGRTWMRHLLADDGGGFQDLDVCVADGAISTGNRVTAIAWPDIHHEKLEPSVAQHLFFCDGNMLDTLRPEHQMFHDVLDFRSRNHHNLGDIHFLFERWCRNEDSVEADIRGAATFLHDTRRPWCESVVVESNHDLAFLKWLKNTSAYGMDPANALFFLRSQLAVFEAIARGDARFSIFEHACRQSADIEGVRFLREDDSFAVGGVEYGMHGHLGANGSRGGLRQFARIGPKSTSGHGHAPGILDGAHQVGVCSLEMGYNKGMSSWAVACDVQLRNGKRQMILMQPDGAWRA
jgi:hypothetical protein